MTLFLWLRIPYTDDAQWFVACVFAKGTLWDGYNNRYLNNLNKIKKLPKNTSANSAWPPVCAASNNSMHRCAQSPGHRLDGFQFAFCQSANGPSASLVVLNFCCIPDAAAIHKPVDYPRFLCSRAYTLPPSLSSEQRISSLLYTQANIFFYPYAMSRHSPRCGHRGLAGSGENLVRCGIEPCPRAPSGFLRCVAGCEDIKSPPAA